MFCIIRWNVTAHGRRASGALPAPSERVDVACAMGSRPGRGRTRALPLWIGSEGPPPRVAGRVVQPSARRPEQGLRLNVHTQFSGYMWVPDLGLALRVCP
eukprot:7245054-Prymnesium_polylepis.1